MAGVLVLGGCNGPLSTIDPAGPHARMVAGLWWVMLAGATMLAALVFGLLAASLWRARRKERAADEAANGRFWIGWLGLAMPGAVLSALLIHALLLGGRLLPVAAPDSVAIGVEARQYGWRFQHPGGRTTEGVLHLPAGRPVDLTITSRDVIHSFWIPRLAGKMDAIPGHPNRLRLIAGTPGRYRGECAEYCGPGHQDHGFAVIAHDADGWAAFTGEAR